jgi:RNA polymerase sigma factor (sigma-70 family)
MYGQILKVVADKKKAENILESIFINLSVTIDNYNKKRSSLLIWLLNMARNAAIEALNDNPAKKDTASYPFTVNSAVMSNYVSKLPVFEKTIFSLTYFRSMPIDEIAKLLSLPLKIIKLRFKLLHKFPEN